MHKENIGRVLEGRYQVLELIGQGGLGTVYKVVDSRLGRIAVVKALHSYFSRDPEFEKRFIHEANAMARINHPNIVQIYDYGEADDTAYMVMEYVDGNSLAQILQRNEYLDLDYAIEIIRQVGEALSYLHKLGIVHRDVKPSNILISKDGRVVLSDFGLAIRHGETSRTEIGTIVGTPLYMSPEQMMGQPVDARSDIYALGSVLYQLLTGRHPYYGDSISSIFNQRLNQQPVSPRELNPTITSSVEQVVLKALARDPTQRYQTVDDFINALIKAGRYSQRVYESRPSTQRYSTAKFSLLVPLLIAVLLLSIILLISVGVISFKLIAIGTVTVLIGIGAWLLVASLMRTGTKIERVQISSKKVELDRTEETIPYTDLPVASTIILKRESSAMAWLLVLNGSARGIQYRLTDNMTIGRGASCDIILNDLKTSRQHTRIYLMQSHFYIEDLGTSNGTLVNGVQVRRQELRDRDEIRIGDTIMLFIQAVSPEDLTVEAKRRLREFDSVWDELTMSTRHD